MVSIGFIDLQQTLIGFCLRTVAGYQQNKSPPSYISEHFCERRSVRQLNQWQFHQWPSALLMALEK